MLEALAVFQLARFWLKADAYSNRFIICDTDATFHVRGWLNARAWANMEPISEAVAVFQLPIGWLNADACWNTALMLATRPTFHFAMFWLKAEAP